MKKPMPLNRFLEEMVKLVKAGKWKTYREAVKKRKEWFDKFDPEHF